MTLRRVRHYCQLSLAAVAVSASLALWLPSASGASTLSAFGSSSAFCHDLKAMKLSTVTPANTASYRSFVKTAIADYEKLANEAPNSGVRNSLNGIVSILKTQENNASVKETASQIKKFDTQFGSDLEALIKATLTCLVPSI